MRNGSYAHPREHEYSVRVIDGVPTECTCPADEHMAAASCTGLPIATASRCLHAAADEVTFSDGGLNPGPDTEQSNRDATAGDELESIPAECDCTGMPAGVPCWPCYRARQKAFEE